MRISLINVVLILFVATALTGCGGANMLTIKPSTDSLGALEHSATGTVHISTSAKGLEVVPYDKEPGTTLLSPRISMRYVTKDDVVSIVNTASIDAIRRAGYTITGLPPEEKADYEVGIKVKSVIGTNARNNFTDSNMSDIVAGDRGKREDNIMAGTFTNTYCGAAIALVKFTNNKTGESLVHVVSGADSSMGFGTTDSSVEGAITSAMQKYKVNLVKMFEAFQQGLLK